ncbi:MAG: hypothetical protein ACI4UJ_11885 [Candidatus Cryptobacteroides sp.]
MAVTVVVQTDLQRPYDFRIVLKVYSLLMAAMAVLAVASSSAKPAMKYLRQRIINIS